MTDEQLLYKTLFLRARHGVELTVDGTSMLPVLHPGDTILVRKKESYEPGDILVFLYKNNELLVHRFLKIEAGRYFCKGDNALRLEDMTLPDIAGKAILHNGEPLKETPAYLPSLSYLVNRAFRKCGYDIKKTKESAIYRFYQKIIMKVEDNTMKYRKNENMDYIPADETSLAVFDPESGDTHFFDETGIDILNCLDDPCDLETLLTRLCEIYEATPDLIRSDVEEFLADVVAKKVVIPE